MKIELTNGKTVEFDEVAARARVHQNFDDLSNLLEQAMAVCLLGAAESKEDVKHSVFTLSTPSFEFGSLANELARHIRNIRYWRDDYPLDGSNPWQ